MPRFYNYKGETFDTRLYKEACELGGLPSVSEICGMLKYVPEFAEELAEKGKNIHELIENIDNGITTHPRIDSKISNRIVSDYGVFIDGLHHEGWEDWKSETVVFNSALGYAGRADRIMRRAHKYVVIDWKTRTVNGKPKWEQVFCPQLAAYGEALTKDPYQCISVIVDRNTGQFHVKKWEWEDVHLDWKSFQCCHFLYCRMKKYDITRALRIFNHLRETNAPIELPPSAIDVEGTSHIPNKEDLPK